MENTTVLSILSDSEEKNVRHSIEMPNINLKRFFFLHFLIVLVGCYCEFHCISILSIFIAFVLVGKKQTEGWKKIYSRILGFSETTANIHNFLSTASCFAIVNKMLPFFDTIPFGSDLYLFYFLSKNRSKIECFFMWIMQWYHHQYWKINVNRRFANLQQIGL